MAKYNTEGFQVRFHCGPIRFNLNLASDVRTISQAIYGLVFSEIPSVPAFGVEAGA